MIKQAGILLTLCATSLVVINIRTLESETLPDARPALIQTTETCLVARWAGHPAAFMVCIFQMRTQTRVLARSFVRPALKNSSAGGWGNCSLFTEGPPSRLSHDFCKLRDYETPI